MQVGVIGINHKLACLELREMLAKACRRLFSTDLPTCIDYASIVLSTCNRTEIYFSSTDLAYSHSQILQMLRSEIEDDFEQKIYSFFGADCFCHLARVTAGLDSAIVAETEIQGQVASAYRQMTTRQLTKDLHFLFQKALHIGKQVRHRYLPEKDILTIEQAVWQLCRQNEEFPQCCSFLCIGASKTNGKILSYLKSKGCNNLSLVSRTDENAKAMATCFNIDKVNWRDRETWRNYDIVICATTAPHWLLHHMPEKALSTRLLLDLSVPRNIDPALGKVTALFDIDSLHYLVQRKQAHRQSALLAAEHYISTTVNRYLYNLERVSTNRDQDALLSFAINT